MFHMLANMRELEIIITRILMFLARVVLYTLFYFSHTVNFCHLIIFNSFDLTVEDWKRCIDDTTLLVNAENKNQNDQYHLYASFITILVQITHCLEIPHLNIPLPCIYFSEIALLIYYAWRCCMPWNAIYKKPKRSISFCIPSQ